MEIVREESERLRVELEGQRNALDAVRREIGAQNDLEAVLCGLRQDLNNAQSSLIDIRNSEAQWRQQAQQDVEASQSHVLRANEAIKVRNGSRSLCLTDRGFDFAAWPADQEADGTLYSDRCSRSILRFCSHSSSPGVGAFSWFPWPVCPPLLASSVSLWTLLRIRGFCDFEFGNSAQQQPVCSLMSFFLCILSSSQDKMHCQLSLTVCTCTPAQQILFRGVMTPTLLSVRPGLHSTDGWTSQSVLVIVIVRIQC